MTQDNFQSIMLYDVFKGDKTVTSAIPVIMPGEKYDLMYRSSTSTFEGTTYTFGNWYAPGGSEAGFSYEFTMDSSSDIGLIRDQVIELA